LNPWRGLDGALKKETALLAIEALKGERRRITRSHLDEIVRIAEAHENGLQATLPGLRVVREAQSLDFIS
jgi:hypothetical protein